MKKYCLLFLLLLPVTVQANDWTTQDTKRQTVFSIALGADWLQTRYIATHPDSFSETNPILGAHPTVQAVDQYFFLCAIGHYLVAKNLSPKYRKYWQYVWIGIETTTVTHNLRIGVKFQT